MEDVNEIVLHRLKKLEALREDGINPFYDGRFDVSHLTGEIHLRYGNKSPRELEGIDVKLSVAGRIVSRRDFGKASFFHIQDRAGRIQGYIKKDRVKGEVFELFKRLDIGDIVGIKGSPFKTRTGELTIMVDEVVLLTKSIRPLPEKWHGLTDVELRFRQRYLDLIVNPGVREVFEKRRKILRLIRDFFDNRGFVEVETPMMHPLPGGATARPFKTYHNALDMELYLRIAPELYLKKLLVGGFERVYEINRNFRNEGLSTQHNPEFTMLEFYQAYATYEEFMELTEDLLATIAKEISGGNSLTYQGNTIDLTPPWERITLKDALIKYGGADRCVIEDRERALSFADEKGVNVDDSFSHGKILLELFEKLVEGGLIQPTFVTHYPVDVSPLSKRNSVDPSVTDRFELIISGREIANAFSELTDPIDQRERFKKQVEEKEEGASIDEDFIRALEYGMPPAAGEGIGIDRLVMLFTDSPSIREVILFPLLRPERKG